MRLLFTLIVVLSGLFTSAPDLCASENPTGNSIENSMSILGEAIVDAESMWRFVSEVNADFPIELARHYYEVGSIYGIRGDIALCQAIIETGWFRFDKGTAVQPHQHNYCGLGVLKRGMQGHSFDTPRDGVTAQIQHLYAYASTSPLPTGEKKLDKRFGLVNRGSAMTWEDLSGKWAANPRYGRDILSLYERMIASAGHSAGDGDIVEPISGRALENESASLMTEEDILKESFATSPDIAPESTAKPTNSPTMESSVSIGHKDPRVRHRRR